MKKLKFIVPVLLLAGLILVGAGCGKYSSPDKTIHALFDAVKEENKEAYLDCFTEKTIELFEETGQELNMQAIKQGLPEEIPEVEILERDGDTAVIKTKVPGAMPMVLKKENGKWKIDMEATMERNYGQQSNVEPPVNN